MKASTLKHTLIAVGLILAIPLSAQAGPMLQGKGECDRPMQMQMHKHGGHDGARKAMRNLNLTDAQRDQLFALKHAQAPQMREKAKIARTAQRELRALSQAETFNAQRAKELADASAQARSEMMQLRAQTGNNAAAVSAMASVAIKVATAIGCVRVEVRHLPRLLRAA